jgi:predicted NAD-dependent protein-ADP-ribosyltransferase YbiA (DUF1768 family)
MVKSHLNPEINYKEPSEVESNDENHSADVYELEILGKNVEVVLGTAKIIDDITYYNVYLVLDDSSMRPIAVYEVLTKNLDNVLDEDGDLDLDKMSGPLLFASIDLSGALMPSAEANDDAPANHDAPANEDAPANDAPANEASSSSSSSDAEPDAELDAEPDAEDEQLDTLPPLPPASKKEEAKEREEVGTGLWIQKFMQNKNYNIMDNEGGGDCLFAVIRDAFAQVGKTYTVGDLRKMLSDAVTEDVFMTYYQLYTETSLSIAADRQKLTEIVAQNNELRKKLALEKNSAQQKVIVQQAKKLKEEFERIKAEQRISVNMLEEYKFMKGVSTIQQFRAVLNTCKFWGDTWAISTLERALNTKFILFSEENFDSGELDNVLQCGQLNDEELEKRGSFTPDYYITMDYNGWHYKLITYKEHGIFTYEQLPFAIRHLIVDKCLEKMSGPYALIPEFVTTRLGEKEKDVSVVLEVMDSDPNTVFTFYGRSNAKPLPGKGSGEKIPKERRGEFKHLATFEDWRKKLSNDWVAPIDLDGHQWNSVEHYYQGSKYKQSNPEIYYQFTLDSRSELGKSTERAKKFKDVEPDLEFAGKLGKEILYRGLEAKFTQHPHLRDVLLATKDATLQSYKPRTEPTKTIELMRLRKNLM